MLQNVIFNALEFGATGDGITLDSAAINAALQECEAQGGGRVALPTGTYLCGPIQLRSNVNLHLEAGATVLFSRDFDHFPLCIASYEGQKTVQCRSPIWGENLRDVSITGAGTFDGQGEAWRPVKRMKLSPDEWETLCRSGGAVDEARGIWWPSEAALRGEATVRKLRSSGGAPRIADYEGARDFLRPNMVQLTGCQSVTLDGPTFTNSPAWNVHLLLCEDVVVRNCTILNPWFAQNGDGLDLESCRNVEVVDCTFDVGDDAICLKSGKDAEGRRRNRPCEAITIRRCTVLHGHGGVVVGSEMSGGVRDVRVEDCDFRGTDVGLRFKTCRGRGGIVENIDIRRVAMANIKGAAISFDMFYGGTAWGEGEAISPRFEPVSEATPQFRGVSIRDVTCEGAQVAIEMRGLPEMPIEAITIENMRVESERGVLLQDARDISLREVQVVVPALPVLEIRNVGNLSVLNFSGQNHRADEISSLGANPASPNGNGQRHV
ncbi:MAG: glycoside hydrolase family 28 protein [Armatimonadetes bacterium]|nr:glycoside hydrolase family 28 protein [Armatimonadota bacterium]